MGVISTSQITLYDHNDARPITAMISASLGTYQSYTKDESSVTYSPDYASVANRLSAFVYVGNTNVADSLANKKWATSPGGASLGVNSYLDIATNQDPVSATQRTYYFEGDYTDPVVNLVTHVMASITLAVVRTGTNVVYIMVRGQTVIEGAVSGGVKNTAKVFADLIRAAGVDNTGVTYKWFRSPYAAADQLDANHADVSGGKIAFRDTADTGSVTPADTAWSDAKSMIVREDAVQDLGLFMVQAKDSDGTIYQGYFQIFDISDPYDVRFIIPEGNVFQNGNGSKNVSPEVWYGSSKVADISAYTFKWGLYDRFGNKSGLIDTARSSAARTISTHTTGSAAVFTVNSGTIPVVGDAVRVISADGLTVRSYEVASATATAITIRPSANGFSVSYPTAAQFAGGTLWIYAGNGAAAGTKSTTGSAALAVTGDDIDGQGALTCEATNPLA